MRNPSTCYYCGAPKINDEHVPPRSFFSGRNYRPIKVPACALHNNAKSGTDQAVLKAMLIPIMKAKGTPWLERWYAENPACAAWVCSQIDILRHHKQTTVIVPIQVERGLEDIPPVAHAQVDYDQWIRAITAGIVYAMSGRRLTSINWDTTLVECWDIVRGPRQSSLAPSAIIEHAKKMNKHYANTHATHWLPGSLPHPYRYPVNHYYFRIGFTGCEVTIEHVFLGLYRFWCTFVVSQVDFAVLFTQFGPVHEIPQR